MSPIKGMTDDNAVPQFPRIGKLRKGAPKPESGNAPGQDLSYWRFTSDNPRVEEAFKATYGDKPQELSVYLPFASIDDCFPTWRERWTTVLQHRCDGETCVQFLQENGEYTQDPVPCPGGCKQVGRLSVILPELLRAGFMGLITMETHSIHDIVNIHKTLLATVQANPDKVLTGVGFWLRRVQQEISTPGKEGKRARRKTWMVVLQPVAAWVLAQIEAADILLQIEGGENGEDNEMLDADYEDSEAATNQQAYPHAPEPTATVEGNTGEIVENAAEPQPVNNWIARAYERRRFWRYVSETLGLDDHDVHKALGVEHIHNYAGTMADAKAALNDYIDKYAAEVPATEETASEGVS